MKRTICALLVCLALCVLSVAPVQAKAQKKGYLSTDSIVCLEAADMAYLMMLVDQEDKEAFVKYGVDLASNGQCMAMKSEPQVFVMYTLPKSPRVAAIRFVGDLKIYFTFSWFVKAVQ